MKILLATDGSSNARGAIELLRRLPFSAQTEVTLLHVIEKIEPSTSECELKEKTRGEEAEQLLQKELACLKDAGWTTRTVIRQGHVANQIIECAGKIGPNLVIAGSHGLGQLMRFLLGSVSQKVMEYAPCSVLIVRQAGNKEAGEGEGNKAKNRSDRARLRILLPNDVSSQADIAVESLAALAWGDRAEIKVLNVVPTGAYRIFGTHEREAMSAREESTRESLNRTAQCLQCVASQVETEMREGDPGNTILHAAREMDAHVIVLGARGKHGVEPFLSGSVSHRVVNNAPCSVWLIRP